MLSTAIPKKCTLNYYIFVNFLRVFDVVYTKVYKKLYTFGKQQFNGAAIAPAKVSESLSPGLGISGSDWKFFSYKIRIKILC